MGYYLVTEDGNYADEFDIEAFTLYEAESEQDLKDKLWQSISDNHYLDDEDEIESGWPKEFMFGTNEGIEYESKEDVLASLGVSEISKAEYDTIKNLLGTRFGLGALI